MRHRRPWGYDLKSGKRTLAARLAVGLLGWGVFLLMGGAPISAQAVPDIVHLGYVIPSNRTASPNGSANLGSAMLSVQSWYADQMSRFGFGAKTFTLDMSGATPAVYTVGSTMTDTDFQTDLWGKTATAATAAGLPVWNSGNVWLLVPQAHVQQADGSILGGAALGASYGSGDDAGVSVIGSDLLARLSPSLLTDQRTYAGRTLADIGSTPMVQDTTFPWFEGTTFSSISSSAFGAMAHELGHAFGLSHDFRNDNNFDGNLMGNGLRGWRGSLYPSLFPTDDCQLTYAAALQLNYSRYFNPNMNATSNTRPSLSIATFGAVQPTTNGQLQIDFSASSINGLAAAFLRRNGDLVAEMTLQGTSAAQSFLTPYWDPNTTDTFSIYVYDQQGNLQSSSVSVTPTSATIRAPRPFINTSRSYLNIGDSVSLIASGSTDPMTGTTANLLVSWDLDGDGVFDTAPSSNLTFNTSYSTPGDRLVYARVTNGWGTSVSEPISIRVVPEPATGLLALMGIVCVFQTSRRRRFALTAR